jgi:predicted esterase
MESEVCLERFQAQPKWEIPVSPSSIREEQTMLKRNIARIHPRNLGRFCQPMGAIRPIRFAATIAVCLSGVLVPPANAQTKPPEVIFLNGKDFRGGRLIVPEAKEGAADTKRWVVVDLSAGRPLKRVDYGARLLPWVGSDKVIALAFSGYHSLLPVEGADEAAKRLVERFEWIKQRYNVHDRMFLSGHSAGAQFAHRFAFRHPELVVGVWANAAGSWSGVEGWGEINDQARKIPFLLSCGELDTGKAFGGEAPYGRLDWMKHFAEDLKKRGFVVRTQIWPDKAHKGPSFEDNGPLIRECFLLSTEGIVPESGKWSGDVKQLAEEIKRKARSADSQIKDHQ